MCVSGEMATVDRVKISDVYRQMNRERGRAGEGN